MADIANVVVTFLTLATDWYKGAAAHNTASATLNNHLRNFTQYHAHILDPIDAFFHLSEERRNPLLVSQAARVVHLLASLREWLDETGFRRVRREVKVLVARRGRGSTSSREYFIERRRSQHSQLALPWFGVTAKETAFITLFERLREAYEKFEADFPIEAYRYMRPYPYARPLMYGNMNFPRAGLRGGFNSDIDDRSETADRSQYSSGRDHGGGVDPRAYHHSGMPPIATAEAFYYPSDQLNGPFKLTKRQKLRQELMLQDLSERLEHNIANMMISNGDKKELRRRQRQRRPLENAQREVLREKVLEAELAEAQQVAVDTHRTQVKATRLSETRRSRAPGMTVNMDAPETDLEDESDELRRTPLLYNTYSFSPNPSEDLPGPSTRKRGPRPSGPPPDILELRPYPPDDLPGSNTRKRGPRPGGPPSGSHIVLGTDGGGILELLPEERARHPAQGEDHRDLHREARAPRQAYASSYSSRASEHEDRDALPDIIVTERLPLSPDPHRTSSQNQLDLERRRVEEERRRMTAERDAYLRERHALHQRQQVIEKENRRLIAETQRLRDEKQRDHRREPQRRHSTHQPDIDLGYRMTSGIRERSRDETHQETAGRHDYAFYRPSRRRRRAENLVDVAESDSRRPNLEYRQNAQGDAQRQSSRRSYHGYRIHETPRLS